MIRGNLIQQTKGGRSICYLCPAHLIQGHVCHWHLLILGLSFSSFIIYLQKGIQKLIDFLLNLQIWNWYLQNYACVANA
jgi:hypothetical protein